MATAYPGMKGKVLEEDEIETVKYQLPAPLRDLNNDQEHYLQKKQEEKLMQEQLQQHEEHYRMQDCEAQKIRNYKTYTESKKMSPEPIKETRGRDNGENSKEGYEVMLDRFYLGNKPQIV